MCKRESDEALPFEPQVVTARLGNPISVHAADAQKELQWDVLDLDIRFPGKSFINVRLGLHDATWLHQEVQIGKCQEFVDPATRLSVKFRNIIIC